MPDSVSIMVDGRTLNVPGSVSVAAAIITAGVTSFRRSVSGQPRAPLCGMGICFECRATIDGIPQRRTCQTIVRDGMEITTDARG